MSVYQSIFTGEEVDALLSTAKATVVSSGSDFNSYKSEGLYTIKNGTIFGSMSNKPDTPVNAGGVLIVRKFTTSTDYVQIFIPNNDAAVYVRGTYGSGWGYWRFIQGFPSSYKRTGTTDQRPSFQSNLKAFYAGYFYFDTDLTKPIWFNGTNWVDATGATV